MTLVDKPLGPFLGEDEPPQETKPRQAQIKTNNAGTTLFKPEAPNDMKNEDLVAKSWIITDWKRRFFPPRGMSADAVSFLNAVWTAPLPINSSDFTWRLRRSEDARRYANPVFSTNLWLLTYLRD
jgi:hypothetical protein